MADVDTSIRITAETKAALQNLAQLDTQMGASARAILAASNNASAGFSRMDGAMGMLAKRSTPALGAAFGSLSSQAISMTTGFSGAAGMIGVLGQSMLMASPLIGGVAIAAAALTTIFIKKKDAVKQTTEALTLNSEALLRLASANDTMSDTYELVRQAKMIAAQAAVADLEKEIEVWKAYFKERNTLLVESGQTLELEYREQMQMLQSYGDQLDVARKHVESLRLPEEISGPPTPTFYEMDQANAAIAANAEARRTADNEAALQNGRRQAELAMELEYTETLRGSIGDRGAAYTAMSDIAIGSIEKVQKVEAAHQKAILTANQMRVVAIAQGAAQMLLLEKKYVGEVLQAVIAGIEAELLAKAILWTAEGVALMFTPGKQAEAAAKFNAAAMAGAGTAALAVIGSAFEQSQSDAEAAQVGGYGGSDTSSTGRTLVSQGPVTLYYNATLVVNGSILDRGDFFSLWNEANLQNLRTAGVDAGQRAKGKR